MPRPKPSKAQRTFIAHPFNLKQKTVERLTELVGTADERIMDSVERALGFYHEGKQHIDKVPRPSDYREAFNPIRKDAIKLLNAVCGLTDYYSEQFSTRHVDLDAIEQALISLISVSADVINVSGATVTKGRPPQNALAETVRKLRVTFRANFVGEVAGRVRRGGVQYRAIAEAQELEFVTVALCEVREIPKENVAQLFLDPRCAVISERDVTVQRIARKTRKSRAD